MSFNALSTLPGLGEQLPFDTLTEIMNNLSIDDIENLCRTNRKFNKICNELRFTDFMKKKVHSIANNWLKHFYSPKLALVAAARENKFSELDALIRIGIDPTYNYNEALCAAISENNEKIVERLLRDPRIDDDAKIITLYEAIPNVTMFLVVLNSLRQPLSVRQIASLLLKAARAESYAIINLLINLPNFNIRKLPFIDYGKMLKVAIKNNDIGLFDLILSSTRPNFDPFAYAEVFSAILSAIKSNQPIILQLFTYPNLKKKLSQLVELPPY